MKTATLAMAAVAAAIVAFGDATAPAAHRGRPRRKGPAAGVLMAPAEEGPGLILVDAQKRVPHGMVESLAADFTAAVTLPWRAGVAEPGDGQAVARAAVAAGAAAAVAVVDSPDAPGLVVAPEEGWAAVNVAKLAADDPPPARLEARFRKEMWRAAAWACGGGNSQFQPCLLRGVSGLEDLDAIPLAQPGPEPNNKMIDEARRRGVKQVRFVSYRQACREGWAPSPTNEMQRAIWEQVRADKERGPANPIVIKPPQR